MAKKNTKTEDTEEVPFENSPSSLDELTHSELRLMHEEASRNLLFAKNIQWRSVGSTLLLFLGLVAVAELTSSDDKFSTLLSVLIIVLCCGVIFILILYQFWQFNEVSRLRKIDKNFSTLYIKICNMKSRRESSAHRYTMLLAMITLVVLGGAVAIMAIGRLS